jgi:hypothetical protein
MPDYEHKHSLTDVGFVQPGGRERLLDQVGQCKWSCAFQVARQSAAVNKRRFEAALSQQTGKQLVDGCATSAVCSTLRFGDP